MKRFALLLVAGVAAVLCVATAAHAQDTPATPMTDAMVAHIRDTCSAAQSTLTRLHASDALLRVNQGQALESISSRLMTPFNTRVAQDQLDSGKLTSITSVYANQLDTFRTDYQQYEEAMSRTLQIDCTKQPVTFYDSLTDARTKRSLVHADMVALQKSLQDYLAEFDVFAAKVKAGTK